MAEARGACYGRLPDEAYKYKMKRLLRWFLVAAGALVGLVVVLLVWVRFAPGSFLSAVNPLIENATGYRISVADVSTRFSPFRLIVNNLAVSEAGASQPLLELDHGDVSVHVLAAIRGKIPFWSLDADRGVVIVPMAPPEQPDAPTEPDTALDLALVLGFLNVSVDDFEVKQATESGYYTTGLDLSLVRDDDGVIVADLEVDNPDIHAVVEGRLKFERTQGRKRLSIDAKRIDLSALISSEESAVTQTDADAQTETETETDVAGETATATAEAPLDWSWLGQLNGLDLLLNVGELVLGTQQVRDLALDVGFDTRRVHLRSMSALYEDASSSEPVPVEGRVDLVPLGLVTAGADADGEFEVSVAGAVVQGQGRFNLNGADGTAVAVSVAAEDLDFLAERTSAYVGQLTPLRFTAKVDVGGSKFAAKDIALAYADADLRGHVDLETSSEVFTLSGRLESSRLSVPKPVATEGEAGTIVDGEDGPPDDAAADEESIDGATEDGTENEAATLVFSDAPIDWTWLERARIDLVLDADELQIFDAEFSEFDAVLKASDGVFSVDPFGASFGGGGFGGLVRIQNADAGADVHSELSLSGVQLDAFGLISAEELEGGVTTVDIRLDGSGVSAHDIASSLNGSILLAVQDATINNDTFELIGSDLVMETLNKLNPFTKSDPSTQLACALVQLDAEDGVLRSDNGIVVETSKMEITGNGKIDLNDETLDIGITPSAKGGIGVNVGSVVKFMKLGGTLAQPSPAADAAGLLKSGAAIGAAMSTGGLSILADGLVSKARNAGNACERALAERPASDQNPVTDPGGEGESPAGSGASS